VNAAQLPPAIRALYSRHPEYFHHEPWELVHVLYSLGYTDDLADEAETPELRAEVLADRLAEREAELAKEQGRRRGVDKEE
jgi:hypothetical protein